MTSDTQQSPLIKIRMEDGTLSIYRIDDGETPPSREGVLRLGVCVFASRRSSWYRMHNGEMVSVVARDDRKPLDLLPITFEVEHKLWGVQVLGFPPYGALDRSAQWNWLRPTQGSPYQYHSKDEADACMRMCYPNTESGKVRVSPF